MDDLMLIFQSDGPLFTGCVLFGDTLGGERGAVCVSSFEKVPFPLMLARLSEQITEFVNKDEKIGVIMRRTDLSQPALRLDEETILGLHADPAGTARTMIPAPKKILARRIDPATTSPLRIGYDTIAATLGDNVYIRRRMDQVECPCCGRWAASHTGRALACRSMACSALIPLVMRSDRWASVSVLTLLADPASSERFFLPREWNQPGPWVSREDLEKKYNNWIKIKKEVV